MKYERLKGFVNLSKTTGMDNQLGDEIDELLKENENLVQDNLDLIDLYKRTAIHLREIGKEELANYFLAQIDEIPTLGTMDLYRNWINRSKVEELRKKIHDDLDKNGITRAYQISIDRYFMELLEE